MKAISTQARYVGGICVAVGMLTACGSQPSVGTNGVIPEINGTRLATLAHAPNTSGWSYKTLYSFRRGSGIVPQAGLIDVNGTLYGTTVGGGKYGGGTVFSITASGREKVLHSFGSSADGANPEADLLNVKGTLYGTTADGGAGFGTVFSLNATTHAENVLHRFIGADGAYPYAGLLNVNGTLYGTTAGGGTYNFGTVFRLTSSGREKVLHSFGSYDDGSDPVAGLIAVKGTLYGTTALGGAYNGGAVFRVSPTTGAESVPYNFGSSTSDGSDPWAALIHVKDTLYGTTENGGTYSAGTAYELYPAGDGESVLHSFSPGTSDGSGPQAGLIDVNGTLYGTTAGGGAKGDGTVFGLSPATRAESLLHSFGSGPSDGSYPQAALLNMNGTLYGTTAVGGAYGAGTVFRLLPDPRHR